MSGPPEKPYAAYARLMGLGLTMAGIVGVSLWVGLLLDRWLAWRFPVFALFFSVLGITGALIHLFKETGRRRS